MEVVLKKSKITKSILNQALLAGRKEFEVGEVLGWVNFRKIPYIVFFKSDTNLIYVYPLFRSMTVENTPPFYTTVHFGYRDMKYTYDSNNKEEQNEFIWLLEKAKRIAEERGQFYYK